MKRILVLLLAVLLLFTCIAITSCSGAKCYACGRSKGELYSFETLNQTTIETTTAIGTKATKTVQLCSTCRAKKNLKELQDIGKRMDELGEKLEEWNNR